MRIVLYLSAIVLLAVCATWAYRVNYATQETMNKVAALKREIAAEREALGVLRAEWAYLNRPDRLRALVAANAETLALVELTPDQFGDAAEVALPPPPAPAPEDAVPPLAEGAEVPPAAAGATATEPLHAEPATRAGAPVPRARTAAATKPEPKAVPTKAPAVAEPLIQQLVARARAVEGVTP